MVNYSTTRQLKQTLKPWLTPLKGPYESIQKVTLSLSGYSLIEKKLYASGVISPDMLCLPDFLGIGTPQSGTTWLHENLRCHPDLYLPEEKEVHYFDRRFYRSLKYYSRKFKQGQGEVKGEITPDYGTIPLERIQFIRKIIPEVKLLLIMRNPIERAWSAARRVLSRLAKESLRIKFEEIPDQEFFAYFKLEQRYRTKERPIHGDYIPGVRMGDYLRIIDNWLTAFPEEQLYLAKFDEIATRPVELLREIFSHLGVSTEVEWESFPHTTVINKNPEHPIPEKFKTFLQEVYCRDIEALYRRFGERFADWRC